MSNPIKALLAKFRKNQVDLPSLIQELQDGSRLQAAPSLATGLETRAPRDEERQPLKPELTGQALLDSQGFPKDIADAFDKTAQETNSIIMSRAPGKAVLALVAHGHDLKCYQVKAKSCDWGPMSGFLCQLTCFNKKGTEKIDYNDRNYVKYFKFIRDKDDPEFKKAVKGGQTPFIPLRLFDGRKEEILKDESIRSWKKHGKDIIGIASHSKKIDGKKQQTVLMEFLLRKSGNNAQKEDLWSVYHGRVFFKKMENSKTLSKNWSNFLDEKISYLAGEPGSEVISSKKDKGGMLVRELVADKHVIKVRRHDDYKSVETPAGAAALFNNWLKGWLVDVGSHPVDRFYPLCVAQNPFPPYPSIRAKAKGEDDATYNLHKQRVEQESYKNAVTGDYDLFAVWPVRPGIGWEDLVRLSDLQIQWGEQLQARKKNSMGVARKESFFVSVPAKPFALELKASPDVYVEVIPGFKEIEPWEDPEMGNINTAVATAAQTLNSFVYAHMLQVAGGIEHAKNASLAEQAAREKIRKSFSYANMAFHSDEGGRPGIDEIDLPVAVFLPESVAKMKTTRESLLPYSLGGEFNRFLVIKEQEYDKFLRLSLALRHKCILVFNHVWLTCLFAMVVDLESVKKTKKTTEFFDAVAKEGKKLGMPSLKDLRMLLSELFIGGQLRVGFDNFSQKSWGVAAPPDKSKKSAAIDESAEAEESMAELANAFVLAVGKEKGRDKRDTLKKAMIHIPARNEAPTENEGQSHD